MSNNETVVLDAELEDIFKKIDGLSLGKAAQLVKAMEARWGVSAAAPVAVAAGPACRRARRRGEDRVHRRPEGRRREQDQRHQGGPRDHRPGPHEAKAVVDEAPKPVKEGVSKAEAADIEKKLKEAGATVELK